MAAGSSWLGRKKRERVRALIDEIRERAASRPILDKRSDEEILGYNEFGTFD